MTFDFSTDCQQDIHRQLHIEPKRKPSRLVGESTELRQIREYTRRVAGSDITTLITGPTGSGKEVVALELHDQSQRRNGPLVAINCAAIPDELLEGELFGYERGAFTGATSAYPGKLALADGGTLFLDEIGELSLIGQAKLLRAIEARQCYRLGGRVPHSFDVRIITATNRDLEAEVTNGRFRNDLYYRVAVAQLQLTGLAERIADIGPLARHFLAELRPNAAGTLPTLSEEALQLLRSHDWPGNARELRNAMEVAMLSSSEQGIILPSDLPPAIRQRTSMPCQLNPDSSEASHPALSTNAIRQALRNCAGNKSAAARALGCSRMTIYRHLRADPGLALA